MNVVQEDYSFSVQRCHARTQLWDKTTRNIGDSRQFLFLANIVDFICKKPATAKFCCHKFGTWQLFGIKNRMLSLFQRAHVVNIKVVFFRTYKFLRLKFLWHKINSHDRPYGVVALFYWFVYILAKLHYVCLWLHTTRQTEAISQLDVILAGQ